MAYLHTLPDYPALEKLFNDNGYTLEVDLANELLILKTGGDEDDLIHYDDLSEELQLALDEFAEKNELN